MLNMLIAKYVQSDLHIIEDLLLFKAKLSAFLKPFIDKTSVSNYSCPNENAGLEYDQGSSDAARAVELFEDAVEEYTNLSKVSTIQVSKSCDKSKSINIEKLSLISY